MPLPVDCLSRFGDVPVFETVYWGYTQANLRAAHEVRDALPRPICRVLQQLLRAARTVFFRCISRRPFSEENLTTPSSKPTGMQAMPAPAPAGTFLYCVRQTALPDVPACSAPGTTAASELDALTLFGRKAPPGYPAGSAHERKRRLAAASLRGDGFLAEALPTFRRACAAIGPQVYVRQGMPARGGDAGVLAGRLQESRTKNASPSSCPPHPGPCRFVQCTHLLHKTVLKRLGFWIASSSSRSAGFGLLHGDFQGAGRARTFLRAFAAGDVLMQALLTALPWKSVPEPPKPFTMKPSRNFIRLLENPAGAVSWKIACRNDGRPIRMRAICQKAAARFASIMRREERKPSWRLVGEIYVRLDPLFQRFCHRETRARGVSVRLASGRMAGIHKTSATNGNPPQGPSFAAPDAFWARAVSIVSSSAASPSACIVFSPRNWAGPSAPPPRQA